jgi:hypothetical protein
MASPAELWQPQLEVEGDESAALARARAVTYEPMMVCLAVLGYRRRLGAVSAEALAQDKLTARRTAHCLKRIVDHIDGGHDWNALRATAELGDEFRAQASVLRWDDWLPKQADDLKREAVWCATWFMKINMRAKLVKEVVGRLDYAAGRLLIIHERLR